MAPPASRVPPRRLWGRSRPAALPAPSRLARLLATFRVECDAIRRKIRKEAGRCSSPSQYSPGWSRFHRERVTGIEPAFSAWEADVLPLNYTRTGGLGRSDPGKSSNQIARAARSAPACRSTDD